MVAMLRAFAQALVLVFSTVLTAVLGVAVVVVIALVVTGTLGVGLLRRRQ